MFDTTLVSENSASTYLFFCRIMKIFLVIILVFNTLFGVVTCFPDDSDKALLAIYESTGQCFHYISTEQNRDKSLAPCQQWCKKNSGSDSYGVSSHTYLWMDSNDPAHEGQIVQWYPISGKAYRCVSHTEGCRWLSVGSSQMFLRLEGCPRTLQRCG